MLKMAEKTLKMMTMIMDDHRIIVRKVANNVGITFVSYHAVFKCFANERCVSKMNDNSVEFRTITESFGLKELFNEVNNDLQLLKQLITADGIGFTEMIPKTKAQLSLSRIPESARPKKELDKHPIKCEGCAHPVLMI